MICEMEIGVNGLPNGVFSYWLAKWYFPIMICQMVLSVIGLLNAVFSYWLDK